MYIYIIDLFISYVDALNLSHQRNHPGVCIKEYIPGVRHASLRLVANEGCNVSWRSQKVFFCASTWMFFGATTLQMFFCTNTQKEYVYIYIYRSYCVCCVFPIYYVLYFSFSLSQRNDFWIGRTPAASEYKHASGWRAGGRLKRHQSGRARLRCVVQATRDQFTGTTASRRRQCVVTTSDGHARSVIGAISSHSAGQTAELGVKLLDAAAGAAASNS